MEVVTRYAPSPTGALHIGGARTALYSWAFARHHGGRFLLRIEDTDLARSTPEAERAALEALAWLGIDYDPALGPHPIPRQSERLALHQAALEKLIASGKAYRCVCTPEEIEAMRARARAEGRKRTYEGRCRDRGFGPDPGKPFCVRLRIDEEGPTRWNDLIAGPSGEDPSQIDDFVIARSDGTPIYHFAVVVDDHDMGITHVIRGREHMTSTPRQLLLYAALGVDAPAFAHVPLLVEAGGKKLSKRHSAVSVQEYRDRGFLPEAVFNFIARLGWGYGDLEIFSREEFILHFTLEGVGKSPSQVRDDKLQWLSQHYIKTLPSDRLHRALPPFLERVAGGPVEIDEGLRKLVELLRERSVTLLDMAERARFYFIEDVEPDAEARRRHLGPEARELLRELRGALQALSIWDREGIEAAFGEVRERRGVKLGELAQPARVAVTGSAASPGIFETLELLGRERTLSRIDRAARDGEAPASAGEGGPRK